ncbi:2'-5' RNA ligase family protein [Bacillus carboniphilus]|uniref:2'-5' RNA ligase family protein n=1 Tax=Bacillus carboniphilus TaxID=86663 RepID=A0ABY9JUT4_9BACI|nr:2'-5' RNA ligase family protein [Bacillus carboniphilus]WLR42197.1 2'-5' RNA ligase family protein [Bacillus carboniphilus]
MLVKRSLCIFPEFKNMEKINQLRESYDPLHQKVAPHITLVFPFESQIQLEILKKHVEGALIKVEPFKACFQGITGSDYSYLFLNVKEGNDRLIELHDRLYSGILSGYHLRTLTYIPHLTVGRLDNNEEFVKAIEQTSDIQETFEFTVEKIVCEILDENENSTVEFTVGL